MFPPSARHPSDAIFLGGTRVVRRQIAHAMTCRSPIFSPADLIWNAHTGYGAHQPEMSGESGRASRLHVVWDTP